MFFISGNKSECFGCEACAQICPQSAINICPDDEGFRYPNIDYLKCIECDLCKKVCPFENRIRKHEEDQYVYGGYNTSAEARFESTSGGAFSAIVNAFCDENYVIFGAEANGVFVFHSYVTDKGEMGKYRKSKYSQSSMGSVYKDAKKLLNDGKKVLFSGTPCQIAGLRSYLDVTKTKEDRLLTIEVVCEGVPSPLYIEKLNNMIKKKHGSPIESLDYRYKGKSIFANGKWDFEEMRIEVNNLKTSFGQRKKTITKDRWFNPFWSVWLQHLMSRPSCYHCPFTTQERVADITLGDLWGVHRFCPELYGNNGGASLVLCNTQKGKDIFNKAQTRMFGHELSLEEALKYQGPIRRPIPENPKRDAFMADLVSDMDIGKINNKWAKKPSAKLIIQKYLYGNRQKVFLWTLKQKIKGLG